MFSVPVLDALVAAGDSKILNLLDRVPVRYLELNEGEYAHGPELLPGGEWVHDTSEIFDSPIALGIGAGKGEPFPYRLRLPIEGKPKSEWPVATFWLHPLTLGVASGADGPGPLVQRLVDEELTRRPADLRIRRSE